MKIKNIEINSYDEIDLKTWLSLNKSYNSRLYKILCKVWNSFFNR